MESIVNALVLLPSFDTLTPEESSEIGSSFSNHSKDMGKSPVGATQDILTESASLAGSAPNENGWILGGTLWRKGEYKNQGNKNKNKILLHI